MLPMSPEPDRHRLEKVNFYNVLASLGFWPPETRRNQNRITIAKSVDDRVRQQHQRLGVTKRGHELLASNFGGR